MPKNLKQKTISAFLWSFVGQYIVQGITFVITVILARLLEPSEFGLIGMLQIFMVISHTLQNFGFNAALIQRSDVTTTDYTTIFYFNFGVSVFIYMGLFWAAPWIASFYNEPQLALITRVYMLILITNGLSFIQTTIYTKHIDFKPQVIIRLTTAILSGVIGIVMAYTGFGVWSLVVQALSGSLLNSGLLWYSSKWRPKGFFSFQSLKKMLGFSSRLFAANMLYNIFSRVDNMVIGKLFSAAELGFYTRAQSLKEFPIKNTSTVLERVMFPVFAAIKDNDEKLRNVFNKFLDVVAFVVFPLMLGMTVIADPLIRVLITDKWLPSVIYLQLFCLFGFVKPLIAININILIAKGRADIILNLEIVNRILFVAGMVIGFHWGIKGFLIAHLIVNYMIYTILIKYSGRFLNHTVLSQYRRLAPAFLLSLAMAALVYGVGTFFNRQHSWQLLVQIMTGIVVYLVSAYILKFKALEDLILLVKRDILKINKKETDNVGSN